MWFASDRGSAPDVHDLFIATRPSLDEPFDTVDAIDELNSANDDGDPWLSPDGHIVLFMSDRSGDAEIYEAQR